MFLVIYSPKVCLFFINKKYAFQIFFSLKTEYRGTVIVYYVVYSFANNTLCSVIYFIIDYLLNLILKFFEALRN